MNSVHRFPRLPFLALWMLSGCASGSSGPAGESDALDSSCEHQCAARECGDDGCGGSCGLCGEGEVCQAYFCVDESTVDIVADAEVDGAVGTDTVEAGPDAIDVAPEVGNDWGNPLGDPDGDGVANEDDNCPFVANSEQADLDTDGLGDLCDPDRDGDGALNDQDCAPDDPAIHPGGVETCGDDEEPGGNGIDEDCDDLVDEPGAKGCIEYFVDGDGDGVGTSETLACLCEASEWNHVTLTGDCDDEDPSRSPKIAETCNDEDDNCNLLIDEGCDDDGDGWCDEAMTVVFPFPAVCPSGGGDCYDYSAEINPGAEEIPADGLDNDCDGVKTGDVVGPIEMACGAICTGTSTEALLCGMEICYPDLLQSAQVLTPTNAKPTTPPTIALKAMEHYGAPNNDLVPWEGESYTVLSNGKIDPPTNHSDKLSGESMQDTYNDNFPPDLIYDVVELEVKLMAPAGVTGFSVDYIFLSTEYDEYIGSQHNDKFYIILEGPQTTGGVPEVINYTDCSAEAQSLGYSDITIEGQDYCFIAVNAAFSEPCHCSSGADCPVGSCACPPGGCGPSSPGACTQSVTDISGTGYECSVDEPNGSSTGWLTTTWDIVPGEVFTLTFHIHDTVDFGIDSAAILDNFRWEGTAITKGTAAHN